MRYTNNAPTRLAALLDHHHTLVADNVWARGESDHRGEATDVTTYTRHDDGSWTTAWLSKPLPVSKKVLGETWDDQSDEDVWHDVTVANDYHDPRHQITDEVQLRASYRTWQHLRG